MRALEISNNYFLYFIWFCPFKLRESTLKMMASSFCGLPLHTLDFGAHSSGASVFAQLCAHIIRPKIHSHQSIYNRI